jgi:hypothetical protein
MKAKTAVKTLTLHQMKVGVARNLREGEEGGITHHQVAVIRAILLQVHKIKVKGSDAGDERKRKYNSF